MLPQFCTVTLAGRVLPDGSEVPASALYGLDGLAVSWGRTSPWEQPDSSTLTLDVVLGPTPWPAWVSTELLTIGAPVSITGSAGAAPGPDDLVFRGTVTDVAVAWDDRWETPRATLTATDSTRQARSDVVGSAPFPVESAASRVARLESLAAASTGAWVGSRSSLAGVMVAAQDVDAQPWSDLVVDVATATDAVAWPVWGSDPDGTHAAGTGFLFEVVSARPYLTSWHPTPDGQATLIGPRLGVPGGSTELSACWTPRAPAVWSRAADTMVTRVSVSWVEAETVPGEGPTEHTETVVDPDREATQGVQGATVSTLLTKATDATALAAANLLRSVPAAWTLEGITLDAAELVTAADGVAFTRTMTLMAREGLPVALVDLAPWSPTGGDTVLAFVEGGGLTFAGGRWVHDVVLSSIGGTGQAARWSDVPPGLPWTWERVESSVRWFDAAVPIETTARRG